MFFLAMKSENPRFLPLVHPLPPNKKNYARRVRKTHSFVTRTNCLESHHTDEKVVTCYTRKAPKRRNALGAFTDELIDGGKATLDRPAMTVLRVDVSRRYAHVKTNTERTYAPRAPNSDSVRSQNVIEA